MPHYLDFKYILNNSVAGKKAQDSLQKRLKDGINSLNKKENPYKKKKKMIQQKDISRRIRKKSKRFTKKSF